MKSAPEITHPVSFLASGGEMGRRIREFDWLGHPLGPPEGWPQSLKVAVRIMLTSRCAMWMGWGPEFYFFCNDAYAAKLGPKRASAPGLSARKVWAETWSSVGPRAESVVRTGEAAWDESLLLLLEHSDYSEETYYTFSYSPVSDDDGSVGGMLCVVTEETERVIGARRLALLYDLGADLAAIKEEADLFRAIIARLAKRAQDLPFALIYLLAADGESVQLACSHGAAAGSPLVPQTIGLEEEKPAWPAATVLAGGETVLVEALAARFTGLPAGQRDEPARSALLVPIAEQGQERPAGFLVAGLNPHRPLDAAYRGFLDLLAGQIAAGLASARAYEAERKHAEALDEASPAGAMTPSDGPRPPIPVADDDPDMREYIARLLSSRFEVTAVADGQAALDRQIELLPSDVVMPELDGLGLLRRMRADPALKSVPVILLSARAEEKRIEAALRQTHDRLQAVLSSITDGLATLDKDWRYSYVSEQAARILGMRPEQLLGGRVWELFPKAEGTRFHEGYHRAVETGRPVEFEEFYPEPINKWLECRCYPSAEGLSVYFHDITPRKQAEAVLRQNEALFSILIEQAPLGVYVVDAQFRLQQVNSIAMPAFAHVNPLIGRDFSEVMEILWGPEVGGHCSRIFRHTLETGERYISPPFSAPRHDLGVEKAFDWETQRVTLPDGQHGVVCYFTDVTERRRAEAALQEAKDAAEAANSSKDRFLAVLSHELRTPLTPVLMAAAALEHDPDLRPDVREDLAMIKRNIELETKLIDDLLDLNRITSGKLPLYLEPLDLNAAVRDVCAICRPALQERGIALELALDDDVGSVSADSARLRQVLWNVLKNAIKFTSEEGTIRVTTHRLTSGFCQVRVCDSGIGIAPEVLPRIFNAFEQGDANVTRQFGGLGLGLAICKALVDLHSGTIRAESTGAGQGSTFIIELPGTAPAALAKSASAVLADHQRMRPLRLLLVEDHADTARALSFLLSRAGYAVITASDVEGAAAAAEREPFDLLISDLGLPDGNGHDVIRRVRAHRIVPAIAMSGYGMDEDVRRSREAGFTEHLVKPIDVPQLITAIRRVTAEKEV